MEPKVITESIFCKPPHMNFILTNELSLITVHVIVVSVFFDFISTEMCYNI